MKVTIGDDNDYWIHGHRGITQYGNKSSALFGVKTKGDQRKRENPGIETLYLMRLSGPAKVLDGRVKGNQ